MSRSYTPSVMGRLSDLREELEAAGMFQRPLRNEERDAIERARQDCGVCDRGSASAKAITHHNLRASELGERSYPCTRGAS